MGAMGTLGAVFTFPILLAFAGLVGAANLITYPSFDCVGSGLLFSNTLPETCYNFPALDSVTTGLSVRSLAFRNHNCLGVAFGEVGCLAFDIVVSGFSEDCLGSFTPLQSAKLCCVGCTPQCSADSREQSSVESPQSVEALLAGVVYTENPRNGSWILETADVKQSFAQLTSTPDDRKVEWLRAQGASFHAATS